MLQSKPLLSVLVPAYNAEKFIAQTLLSLSKQTYSNIEILACDDGSTDGTLKQLNSFRHSNFRIFSNQKNLGKNETCKILLSQANGEYISIHDADDISTPDRFLKQITFLEENPEYALCGTNFISFIDTVIVDRSNLETTSDLLRNKIKTQSQFHGPTIVIRKKIISEVGGLYRYFTRAEDIDFTMRVAEKFPVANLPEHLYYYRIVPTSLTNTIEGYNIERAGHAKLLYYLAEERKQNNGKDSLMANEIEKVDKLVEEFSLEYHDRFDEILRNGVYRLLWMRMYKNATLLSIKAMKYKMSFSNFKCFVYTVLMSVKGRLELMTKRDKIDLDFLYD